MDNTWINVIFDWCVNFLVNIASAIGVTYEALNVFIFVIMVPTVIGISMAINLYFIGKSVMHRCVLRETTTD